MVGLTAEQLATLGDDWETLVTQGIDIMTAHDRNRWIAGDLACVVSARYGRDGLMRYAGDIRVRRSVIYDYARVSAFYPLEVRDGFPLLSWSHWRTALAYGDMEAALDALLEADSADMPVDAFTRKVRADMGKPIPPKLIGSAEAVVRAVNGACVVLELVCPADEAHALVSQLAQNVRYIINVKQKMTGGNDGIPF